MLFTIVIFDLVLARSVEAAKLRCQILLATGCGN